jgi:hypothetical protein
MYPFLKKSTVVRTLPIIDRFNVSRVARGKKKSSQTKKGFLQIWLSGGSLNSMATKNQTWNERRTAFIARHTKGQGKLWQANGYPTNKHLALISWGYSPDPKGLQSFLKAIGSNNRNISDYVKM